VTTDPTSIFDGIGWLKDSSLLNPDTLESMATQYASRAKSLRDEYKPYMVEKKSGGLFGTGLFAQKQSYLYKPPGSDTANGYAVQLDEMSKTYKDLAQRMRDNPEQGITDDDLAKLDPNGPDVNRDSMVNNSGPSRAQLDHALRINSSGGFGLNIPTYGS